MNDPNLQRCPHCRALIISDVPIVRADLVEYGVRLVAAWFNVEHELLRTPDRSHRLVVPRQVLWAAMRRVDDRISYPRIGEQFDRDHTTVMHGVARAEEHHMGDVHAIAERLRGFVRQTHAEGPLADRVPQPPAEV